MSQRIHMVSGFYSSIDEDGRLVRSRHGQLEYATTMHYIRRYAAPGSQILEVGAGTGRYSVALARNGHALTAVELVQSNLEQLRRNAADLDNLHACQGDALDLSRFVDSTSM